MRPNARRGRALGLGARDRGHRRSVSLVVRGCFEAVFIYSYREGNIYINGENRPVRVSCGARTA